MFFSCSHFFAASAGDRKTGNQETWQLLYFMGNSHLQPLQDEAEIFKGNPGQSKKCSSSWSWPAMSVDLFLTAFEKSYKGFLGLYVERKGTGQSGEQSVSC